MSLLKPTTGSRFHIDFAWWQKNDRDWRVFLRSLLCAEHQTTLADVAAEAQIDWIDPKTAEVHQVDAIRHALMNHCALQPDFVDEHTTVVEAAFRLLLVNGNQPMTAVEFSRKLGRPADTILRTLAGPRVYRGLRPVDESRAEEPAEPLAMPSP
jgi:hypothetical protein